MKKINKFFVIILAVLFVGGVLLTGCASNSTNTVDKDIDSQYLKIKEAGKIILGTSADYPPYEFHSMVDGKDTIVGFDIEIAKKIAEELGVELEILDMDFAGLIGAMQAGKIDFIVSGMSPTPDRDKEVDFSQLYYVGEQSMMVKKEDLSKYKVPSDFDGKLVGVQTGTIQEDIAKDNLPNSNVKLLEKLTSLVMELQTEKVEGIVVAGPVAEGYVSQNPELAKVDFVFDTDDGSAIAVPDGSDLVYVVDYVISNLKESGELNQFIIEAQKLAEEQAE